MKKTTITLCCSPKWWVKPVMVIGAALAWWLPKNIAVKAIDKLSRFVVRHGMVFVK